MTGHAADLVDIYPLNADQVSSYQKDGHILLHNVCPAEDIAQWRSEILRATLARNTETRPLNERDTYGKAFLQVMNLWIDDDTVGKFTLAKRFAGIAARLMGVSAVRLYHDQALFKEPQGGHTPWHQDQYYWPMNTDNCITMWMPLVDASEEMGTMTFASGSHKEGFLGNLEISDKSEQHFKDFVANKGFRLTQSGAMKAGDATFHSGWTLHSAPGNSTDTMREVMTIIYYADGAKINVPDNPNRQRDLETWFPGQSAGELAGSQINPLVFGD